MDKCGYCTSTQPNLFSLQVQDKPPQFPILHHLSFLEEVTLVGLAATINIEHRAASPPAKYFLWFLIL